MHLRKRERGMTFWGLLFVLGVLAFSLFILFKLIPPYNTDFKIKSALDSLARQPDVASMTKGDIATSMGKRFDIDMVEGVNIGNSLTVEPRGRNKVIRMRYENVVPLFGNISLLLEFDHAVEVRSSVSE